MAYINVRTLEIVTAEQIIRSRPDVSFPNMAWDDEVLSPFGYSVLVEPSEQPIPEKYQKLVDATPTQIDGVWTKQYNVVSLFEDYVDEFGNTVTKQQQQTIAENNEIEQRKKSNKQMAENLLLETDWYEGKSVTDTTQPVYLSNIDDIIEYRCALRLIAIDAPEIVDEWPTKPDAIWVRN